MAAGNSEERWGWVSQLFHWVMALGVLANMGIGLIAEEMALSPQKLKLFLLHKSIGMTILGLAILRLGWRLLQTVPLMPSGMRAWQRRVSAVSHTLLYALIFAMPLSGWMLNSAANVPLRWFGWFRLPAIAPTSEAWEEAMEWLHVGLFYAFAALIALHAVAALKHHFVDRDAVLRRMLPGGERR
jgi:cytochrome b561